MARLNVWAAAGAAVLASAGWAFAQDAAQTAPSAPAVAPTPDGDAQPAHAGALPRVPGYLGKARIPNSIAILPPPPPPGSLGEKQDEAAYRLTRTLEGTPRWAMAIRDVSRYIPAFDCPLGFALEQAPQPVLTLLARVSRDSSALTNLAKDHFNHPRPFIGYGGTICSENDRSNLITSYSYPSGHSTYSWALALILAEMLPDRATEILARARAFGESRVVCGVHTVSDVEAGRTNGATLVSVLHSDAAFRADFEAAKTALLAAMAAPHATPDVGQCKVEADAEAHTPWINPTGDK